MHEKNADLMYRYGRALLNRAIEKNEVFERDEDLEVALEALDVSRTLLNMMLRGELETEMQELKIKQTLCLVQDLLGDACLEFEDFDQAQLNYKRLIECKKTLVEQTDRGLAEAHYKLALAYEYGNNLHEAMTQLRIAQNVMNQRKQHSIDEIPEIEELVHELQLKINDVKVRSEPQEIKDVSSLVKRKE